MQIKSISLYPVAIPRNTGFKNQHVVVEVVTNEAINGYGEMSDFSHLPRYSVNVKDLEYVLNDLLVGEDPFNIEKINATLSENFPEAMYYYEKGSFIRNGVDQALHDVCAKSLDIPLSSLLGGRIREKIKVCYPIFRQRFQEEIETNLQVIEEQLKRGFDTYRIYVGKNLEADVLLFERIDQEFGDKVHIKSIDFSHLLDWKEALRFTEHLERFNFDLIESPAFRNDFQGLHHYKMKIKRPVSEHVWSLHQQSEMIKHDSVDIFNVCPSFIGGLNHTKKIISASQIARKSVLLGTTQEMSLATAAISQIGSSIQNLDYISDPTGPALYTSDVTTEPVQYENGYLIVPDHSLSGVGVNVDKKRIDDNGIENLSWGDVTVDQLQDRTST
ncbi:mandelate racemase/muconate lactonizing enzyme family protein [Natribacillus halophilus]|uniref:Galactonate dehydratase n=1 Tax=Natribacillus halophilus TaxID=549003 RepID=A0A1G8RCJ1_9BACI|nr:enolase C-terminal domain-like protein [Natribacillus halophilus]SDJ14639.1 galactonate dehydratase [Natribacillus halophilus]